MFCRWPSACAKKEVSERGSHSSFFSFLPSELCQASVPFTATRSGLAQFARPCARRHPCTHALRTDADAGAHKDTRNTDVTQRHKKYELGIAHWLSVARTRGARAAGSTHAPGQLLEPAGSITSRIDTAAQGCVRMPSRVGCVGEQVSNGFSAICLPT